MYYSYLPAYENGTDSVPKRWHLTLSNPMSDLVRHYDFPVPDAFPHVVQTLAKR
jgi:hypothetical protein